MSDKLDGIKVPILDGLTKAVGEATKVIELKDLEPNYSLAIVTQDETEYDITVLEPQTGRVLVKGGLFAEPTECKLNGSTFGSFTLWMNRIAVGMCMEFSWNRKIHTTFPVKIIGWRIDSSFAVSKAVH